MNAKKWIALVLFALAVCLNLLGNYFDTGLLERVSKPVLMPLVLLNALLALEDSMAPKWLYVLLSFALCFHCAGDIFLMVPGFPFFVAGLVCFLAGHVFYIAILLRKGVAFREDPSTGGKSGSNRGLLAFTLAVVVTLVICIVGAMRMEGPVKYAVIVYGSVLMMVSALGLWGVFNRRSGVAGPIYWLCFCGGIIFIFSDFLVAWRSLLGHTFPHIGFVIMLSYILAECLIVTSMVRPYLTAGRRRI